MITIIGKCLGVASQTLGQGDKQFTQTFVGVSVAGDDPFKTPTVTSIVIGDKILNDKLVAQLNKFKGQEVQIVVSQTLKVFRNNPQSTFYFVETLPAPNYLKTSEVA
jgi:hypothetical protein